MGSSDGLGASLPTSCGPSLSEPRVTRSARHPRPPGAGPVCGETGDAPAGPHAANCSLRKQRVAPLLRGCAFRGFSYSGQPCSKNIM